MKKKTCRWLDSNLYGGISFLSDNIYPCCGPGEAFYSEKGLNFLDVSCEELREKRKDLARRIAAGEACVGCDQIIEREEEDIDVGKIHYLSIGLFATCNLRCKYCYFTHSELGEKIPSYRKTLLPIVKQLAEHDMLKDNVTIGAVGGEPTLIEDLPETLNYLAEHYPKPGLILLSNSSIKPRVDKMIAGLKAVNKKMTKSLYTSVDAGTAETYEYVRGKDLFKDVCNNILNYAKSGVFDNIILKYILMFDHSNTSDKDVFGFINILTKVLKYQKGTLKVTIDCDMCSSEPFDEEMIAAAGKMYYVVTELFGLEVVFCGGGLVLYSEKGRERIDLLQKYAMEYKYKSKRLKEQMYLFRFYIESVRHIIRKYLKQILRIIKLVKILYVD